MDTIYIHRLAVDARVGVPEEERAAPQRLEICVEVPIKDGAGDELTRTVNYYEVCETVKRVAGAGERKLIETLAEDLCAAVLAEFAVARVTAEVRKFVIPEAEFVAVKISRPAGGAP